MDSMASVVGVAVKANKITQNTRETGGLHSYSREETSAFTEVMNSYLAHDKFLAGRLPLDAETAALFEACTDGVLLCKLIALVDANAVDERAVNYTKLSKFKIIENNNLAINAAMDIGCRITNIGADDISAATPHLILGLLWQIIRLLLTKEVSLKEHPELVRLLEGEETLQQLLALPPETILVRWVNYHLAQAGRADRKISRLGKELADSEVYSILMGELYGARLPEKVYLADQDLERRAGTVLSNAKAVGVRPFIKARDVVSGNTKLNLAFVAELFNDCPGFKPLDEVEQRSLTELDEEDRADSREARTFKLWLNSLNLVDRAEHGGDGAPCAPVTDFFPELSESLMMLRVMDKLSPGTIPWRKVAKVCGGNKIKKVGNGNIVVDAAREMDLVVVNIGGTDIAQPNKKMILAIMWQLMRKQTVDFLSEVKGDGTSIEEKELVAWANKTVDAYGGDRKSQPLRSLHDKALRSGRFLLELCDTLSPDTVNWDIVTDGESDGDAFLNARYILSVCRKIGACCFCSPEDIVEVKPKMMLLLLASLWPFAPSSGVADASHPVRNSMAMMNAYTPSPPSNRKKHFAADPIRAAAAAAPVKPTPVAAASPPRPPATRTGWLPPSASNASNASSSSSSSPPKQSPPPAPPVPSPPTPQKVEPEPTPEPAAPPRPPPAAPPRAAVPKAATSEKSPSDEDEGAVSSTILRPSDSTYAFKAKGGTGEAAVIEGDEVDDSEW